MHLLPVWAALRWEHVFDVRDQSPDYPGQCIITRRHGAAAWISDLYLANP